MKVLSAVYVLVLAVVAYGWVMNIVELLVRADEMSIGVLIVRAIGIFVAPLGAVMGYV